MMTKHTPGPWTEDLSSVHGPCAFKVRAGDSLVAYACAASVSTAWPDNEHQHRPENAPSVANARLIAAAPDLLAALEEVVGSLGGMDWEIATDAIAKAKG